MQISEAVKRNEFDQAVREESEFIIKCVISKINWDFSEKSELELLLCKSLVIYRNKAALGQFLEGLQRIGLLKYVKENPTGFKDVFCVTLSSYCGLTIQILAATEAIRQERGKRPPFYGGKSFWTTWISLIHRDFFRSF